MSKARTVLGRFIRDESGATAAMYALGLPALLGMAGIGFDYARLASLDTELQNAADQAALAGATQLDEESGAIARATSAAQGGLVSNSTLFANDGGGTNVSIGNVYFYATRADAEADTNRLDPSSASADGNARYIRVAVATRTANYALTPVVGAFSGDIDAEAVAGLGGALCRTPPLMMCNPNEAIGSGVFNPDAYAGIGMVVKQGDGKTKWAPGNFGFLDTVPGGGGGMPNLRKALAWNSPPGQCVSQQSNSTVDTEPGNKTSFADAFNTRFDIYDGNNACPDGGVCTASANSISDRRGIGASCDSDAPTHPYAPTTDDPLDPEKTLSPMGHPRDICHAANTGSCGNMGNGVWDRDAYFRSRYKDGGTPWSHADWRAYTGLPANATRYEVYRWEIDNRGKVIGGVTVLDTAKGNATCSPANGYGDGLVPDASTIDRRRLSVAVVDCDTHGVKGRSRGVPVHVFMDVFLVEPSFDRSTSDKKEIYVEIIGETQAGSRGEVAGSVVRRDMPYLVR